MKILALLCALALSHLWPSATRLRRHDWLAEPARRLQGHGPDWLPVAIAVAVSLVAGVVLAGLAWTLAGHFGLLVVGVATLAFVLGPRDLDEDIRLATDEATADEAQAARDHLRMRPDATASEAAATALHAALARWFGVLLWFAVLGVPGALMYRTVRASRRIPILNTAERAWFDQVLDWLNWPVLLLLTGSLALVTDFDRVRAVFRSRDDRWQFPPVLLDDLAHALCPAGEDPHTGLATGRELAWRALGLWLVALSVLLLFGVLT